MKKKKENGNFFLMGCKISMDVSRSVFLWTVSRDIFMSTTFYGVILHRYINANIHSIYEFERYKRKGQNYRRRKQFSISREFILAMIF